ncbi:MAG: PGPGW domain-containing protein [Gammaproteobacteria bacterium]|nr:PGPGW domain-containing protein [Gammaproteobacteria bacterium]
MLDWITIDEITVWYLAAFSIVSFIATLVLVPFLVVRIPEDYFAEIKRQRWEPWAHEHPFIRWSLLIAKNILGYIFIVLGIAMLVLPGQGILTILIGIMFINFPGKYRLERWAVTRPPVLRAINNLRRNAGRQPLTV